MVRGHLKGADGTVFPLRHITTIGQGNSDNVIKLPGVDNEHCKIDYSEQDGCYVLQDLNTTQGTYVNEVRVQNAAVRLAPGDLIRFGYNGQTFELVVQSDTQVSIPPVSQKPPVWHQVPALLSDTDPFANYTSSGMHSLPHITSTTSLPQTITTWSQYQTCQPLPIPRPPVNSRPLSAGAARRNVQNLPVGPAGSTVGGWMRPTEQPLMRTSSIPDLQDKDLKISQLNQEVTKLRNIELEAMRKDTFIQQLQQEIATLQVKVFQEPSYILGGDRDMSAKLLYLETEVSVKKEEIAALKIQLDKLQGDQSPLILRQELGERVKEISQLRTELDRVKKDKNIISGLVTQMQRDLSNKDSTISRLTREAEVLKKDIREKDVQLLNVKNPKDVAKAAEENSARDKELTTLRQKFKLAENKLQEQLDIITGLRAELDRSKSEILSERENQRKISSDLDSMRAQLQDVQRTERVVRVDLEQTQQKNERFRSRVIQLIFSTPAVKTPDKELSDDDLIGNLKQLVDDRAKLLSRIEELEANVTAAKSGKEELLNDAKKLREAFESSAKRLKENGRLCGSLKEEIIFVQSLCADEDLTWIRGLFCELLTAELDWENLIEQSLEKCGVKVAISNENPGQHIQMLFSKWELALAEVESLQAQIRLLEEEHKAHLELKLKVLTTEMENKIQDAVEKTKLKGDQDLNTAIDEIRASEKAKRKRHVEAERRKTEEAESLLAQLRTSFEEHQQETKVRLEEASQAVQAMETMKVAENILKEQMNKIQQQLVDQTVEFTSSKEEMMNKFKNEQASYEEQIKQHSVTICTMEDKLSKLVKEKKSISDQLTKLKSKPAVPPKVIVQRPREEIVALEQVLNALRHENAVLKKEIVDSQNITMALRRDLAGAAARLSDISGEMNESQKQEMERNRELLGQKAAELTDLRQQMVKLSQIIDSQKKEIQRLQGELSKEKTLSNKYKHRLEGNSGHVEKLEKELQREKEEQKRQLELLETEGRITSDLTSLGAQCRGERHEQVIARQREALIELRSRVKTLEQSRPPVYTEDQALQKIMHLQRELAELRTNQALADNVYIQENSALDKQIGRARGFIGSSNAEAEMERSAHRETMDALDCSEASYLSLCRCLADTLHIEDIEGLSSLAHIPKDERERLVEVRKKACQLFATRIEALQERLARKDTLLEDYESQLAKLKATLVLEERRAHEVDNLKNNVRSRAEESEYLRETLNRTRDRLNQEKRLNNLIKDRKVIVNDSTRHNVGHHHCKVEDPKDVVKKKQESELLKRKNYEIKKLKKELCDTERELHETHRNRQLESDLMIHADRCGPSCSGCAACRALEIATA
ncbi:hypothetical protein BsWGS_26664 [Bradybaena similaris]